MIPMRKKSTPFSNKWLTLLFTCLLLSCTVCNAATTETLKPDTITLSLTEAGTLHERIGNNKKLKIECLRLKGMLNIDDIQFIREMAGCYYDTKGHKYDGHLRYLDISGATLTNTDNKEVSIYPRDPSEYEGTPWPSAEAYINDKGTPVAIFAYLYDMEEIVLPAKLKSIGDDAFIFCRSLKSINIPESVQKIGLRAFFGCSSLKSMKLPIGITEIKSGLLSGCTSLTSVEMPLTVTRIGNQAFYRCTALVRQDIPSNVTEIGSEAFCGCSRLIDLTIPSGIKSIGEKAFKDCNALTTLYALGASPIAITSNTFENVNKCTLYVPQGSRQEYWLKDGWGDLNRVAEFDPEALITEPVSIHVQTAGTLHNMLDSFRKYRIQNLKVTGNINDADIHTIRKMSGYIDPGAYMRYDGRLQHLDLSGATIVTDDWDFATCRLTSVALPTGLTAIPNQAFAECNELESAPIPQGVTSIGGDAFGNCHKLASITLPAGLTNLQSGAFFGCGSLTSIVIPSGVKVIEGKTFSYCTGLKSLTLQEGTTDIWDYAFTDCTLLTTITLPSTLGIICDAAFANCNSLKSIYALNPQGIGIKGKPFEEYTQSQCTLYVPEGSMYNYQCWEEWYAFNHIVEFSPTGINGVHSAAERREVERYDTSGRRLTSPTKGLNIVRFNDGTTRKVMK
jgi:surface antigen bspA